MSDSKIYEAYKKARKRSEFHPLSESKVFIFFEKLIKIGTIPKEEIADEIAVILKKLLSEGKHPTLNPCVDKLWEFDQDDVMIGLKGLILENSFYTVKKIDNNMNHFKMEFSIDIVFGNLEPFVKSKELQIEKVEIQTAFYRKTMKG